MAVTLYVDELTSDKTFGMARKQSTMLENANRIRINLQTDEGTGEISAIAFQAGRYVGLICHDVNNEIAMMFFDLNRDEEKAKKIATKFEERLRRIFMKNFYEVSKNYKRNYGSVELVEDKGFAPDMSAN